MCKGTLTRRSSEVGGLDIHSKQFWQILAQAFRRFVALVVGIPALDITINGLSASLCRGSFLSSDLHALRAGRIIDMSWSGAKWQKDPEGWWSQQRAAEWTCTVCSNTNKPKSRVCGKCAVRKSFCDEAILHCSLLLRIPHNHCVAVRT